MNTKKNVIVITGGSGGIGQACARVFKNNPLIITDYSQESVDKTVATLTQEGYEATGIACDITDKQDVEKLVKFTQKTGNLQALVHTAGVSGTVQDLKKVFTIDLIGTDILMTAFYEIAAKNSVAVLLSSMMAHVIPANDVYDEALANPQAVNSFDVVKPFVNGSSDNMYNFAKRGVILLS